MKFYRFVIKRRKAVFILFAIAALACAFLRTKVAVNYDMNDYLPEDAASTVAIDKMEEEFDDPIPNAQVMVPADSKKEALAWKAKLESISGVEAVIWLDDTTFTDAPLEFYSEDVRGKYYKDGYALFRVAISEDENLTANDAIRELIGEDGAMTGSSVSTAVATAGTITEVRRIAIIAVFFIIAVLLLTTKAWAEPVVVMIGMGVAVLLNMGSNLIFGEISFVTNAAGSILQIAVSLDYSVFLMHRFEELRPKCDTAEETMLQALLSSTSSILSSGLTTVIGFAALCFMRFRIGPDLGLALAKGIAISLVTVFVFVPGLIMMMYPLIEKTKHRSFLPDFHRLGNFVIRTMLPMALVFVILLVPTCIMDGKNSYYYGATHIYGAGTTYGNDTQKITDTFGETDTLVLMVPKGNTADEYQMIVELENMDRIVDITSILSMVGPSVPSDMLPSELTDALESENYRRIVINAEVNSDSDEAFLLVEEIRSLAEKYYGEDYYLAGQSASTYDLKDTVTADMTKVNLIAIAAVFLVLLLILHSFILSALLVFSIEGAIWINMAIPALAGNPIFYIAYLIISSIQLGATVDYAILMTERYRENRQQMDRREAVRKTIMDCTGSVMTSGTVLTIVGFLLYFLSTHRLLAQLGLLLGVGTVCSLCVVVFILPGLLYLIDRFFVGSGSKKRLVQ